MYIPIGVFSTILVGLIILLLITVMSPETATTISEAINTK